MGTFIYVTNGMQHERKKMGKKTQEERLQTEVNKTSLNEYNTYHTKTC